MRPFIPGVNPEFPESYGLTIKSILGKTKEYEIASHAFINDGALLEFVTSDDKWHLVPFPSIEEIEFDKRFSKIMALAQQKQKAQQAQKREST